MTDFSMIHVQAQVVPALRALGALERTTSAVRTSRLAKKIRALGVRADAKWIAEQLEKAAPSPWGRSYAAFVGGRADPLDQHEWALPPAKKE